jgi:hypothetical protein
MTNVTKEVMKQFQNPNIMNLSTGPGRGKGITPIVYPRLTGGTSPIIPVDRTYNLEEVYEMALQNQ